MTEDDAKRWIATFNDQIEFYCGRKVFDPANIVWLDYFMRDYFDPRLFAECIREYFEGGGSYDREMLGTRLRAIYGRKVNEQMSQRESRCPCGGHKVVWILTDRHQRVVDFRDAPISEIELLRMNNVINSPCPFCTEELSPNTRLAVKSAYMPMNVNSGSNFMPPNWEKNGTWLGKEVIYQWIMYRLEKEKR